MAKLYDREYAGRCIGRIRTPNSRKREFTKNALRAFFYASPQAHRIKQKEKSEQWLLSLSEK